jgi:amino acid adenylation domain-containing protein
MLQSQVTENINQPQSEVNMSKVSVIIPVYNRANFLPEAIKSVLNQTYPVFEIIVVDDSSTYHTRELCDRYPSVTYIYQKNQGISAARNTGLWNSTGEYIIFFDSDDRLLSQAVEIGINAIAPRPEVGFVFGNYVLQSLNPDGTYRTEEISNNHEEIANYENILAVKLKIQCSSVLFRRTVLEKLKGFDPQAKAAADDNLYLRIAREYPIYFHNQTVFEYRDHNSNISKQPTDLIETIRTHELQWDYVQRSGKKQYLIAYEQGKQAWIKLFIEPLPYEIMKFTQSGEWIKALRELRLILNYDPKLQFVDREIYDSVYKNLMDQLRKLPFDSSLDYWKKQLAGIPPLLSLPTDRTRPAEQSFQGQSQSFIINQNLTNSLNSLNKNQEKLNLFTTLLTVFKILLYRYTGSEDIFLGSPIAKHINEEIFVNSVIFRTDLSGNPHFQELLQRVKNVVIEAQEHQELPYCLLLEELLPVRDPSYPPLFQVTFVFEEYLSYQKVELSNLTASPWVLENNQGKFDLTLFIKETDHELQVSWVYNTDLFEHETITRMHGHFQTLLGGIIAEPKTAISQLPLLTPTEQQQILTQWNQTDLESPGNQCFYQLFEQQVPQNTQKIAVEFEGEQITYQELNKQANQLAHYLQKIGVKPDSLVGICVERSLKMIVGLLGILKAGGAYIPLDPSYPSERLEYMVSHSQMRILVTEEKLISLIPTAETQVICLDKDWDKIEKESTENPTIQVTADNLAYIIYTSGSTGKPKGVQINHSGVTNFLTTMKKQPGLTENDILIALTTISFDIAVLEIYLPLISGAKIVLVSQETAIDGQKLLKLLTESQATIMQATPATWQLLLAARWEKSPNLKVLCGGEALTPKLAHQLLERVSSLWNMYGPTEATVWATIYEVNTREIDPQKPAISIGKPIGNTQIYILNEYLQPTPIGVPGELYIGGICLARGYLHRPDLTEERFIKNPFSNDPNSRLYKTGDLTRYLPSGKIEYISRIDNQVKIRGFRIELGEIEVLLAQHQEIKQLAVIVREDLPGDKRLVAYIVPHQGKNPTTNELREFLGQNLPKYMIPSAFVSLESLPLTPNGKIDRRTLLTYELERSPVNNTYMGPQNETEEIIVNIWQQVLNIEKIGINDNFFELGGNSLLAVYMWSQIEKKLDKKMSLNALFQAPTIAGIAKIFRTEKKVVGWKPLQPIQTNGNKRPFFAVINVGFLDLAKFLEPDQPFYRLVIPWLEGIEQPATAIQDIASRFISEMRTIQPQGPYLLGGHSFGTSLVYEMAQQLIAKGEKVDLLALIDPSLLIHRDPFQYKVNRLVHYSQKLWQLNWSEKIYYIQEKINKLQENISSKSKIIRDKKVKKSKEKADIIRSSYVLKHYSGKVTLFLADITITFDVGDYNKLLQAYNQGLGWGGLAKGGLDIHVIDGDHITLMTEPHVKMLAEKLTECLNQGGSTPIDSSNTPES